jgi:hypothetical protein
MKENIIILFRHGKLIFFKKAHQIEKTSRRFLMKKKVNIFSMKKQKKKK